MPSPSRYWSGVVNADDRRLQRKPAYAEFVAVLEIGTREAVVPFLHVGCNSAVRYPRPSGPHYFIRENLPGYDPIGFDR